METYKEVKSSSINAKEDSPIDQSDVIKYHRLNWVENYGPKYKFIYDETSEYMQFVDGDTIDEEAILLEIFKLYIKSSNLGEYDDVIKNIETDIKNNLKNIKRLKEGSDKDAFLCRLESFTDNILYATK